MAVVFDTNVYRSLSPNDFGRILELERGKGVLGHTTRSTIRELVANLHDRQSKAFGGSWAALRRLAQHCSDFDGKGTKVRMVADTDETLAVNVLGLPRGPEPRVLPKLIGFIAMCQSPEHLDDVSAIITAIHDGVQREEGTFRDALWDHLVLPFCPEGVCRSLCRIGGELIASMG